VFYVQNPANVPDYRDAVASALNTPSSVDVTFANGAVTDDRQSVSRPSFGFLVAVSSATSPILHWPPLALDGPL
jgi:hypothetical protein